MHLAFYHGAGLSGLAVRLDTRRPGQSLSDVPAHTALIIGETLYEMILPGWHSRPAEIADYAWSVEITGLDEAAALAAANFFKRARYGLWVDLLIGLCRYVPNRWLSCTRGMQKCICSAFAKAVLESAGWHCPYWLAHQYAPESPNDLWFAVRPNIQRTTQEKT